jgi:hypothetical protein
MILGTDRYKCVVFIVNTYASCDCFSGAQRNVINDAGCSSWLNGRQISSHAFDPHTPSCGQCCSRRTGGQMEDPGW